jgi:hypothetical protein
MKKLAILSAIAMSGLIYSTANAQMSIHVGFHFGTPVVERAPVYEQTPVVYNSGNDYYYLPEVDAYYSVNEQCYYYNDGDNWISAAYLPGEYRDYDWRTARRYELRTARPYMHDEVYRSRYSGHEMTGLGHGNDSRMQGGYDRNTARYNAPVARNYGQRYDNSGQGEYRQQMPQSYGQGSYNRGQGGNRQQDQQNGQRYDNRGQGRYSQPTQQNNGQRYDNRGQGGYNQAAPQNNSEQGSRGQSAQPNRGQGYSQPSNQNGQDHSNRDAGQHYSQASPQGGFRAHTTMTRF